MTDPTSGRVQAVSQEVPAFLVRFLAEAMEWAEKAPEHGQEKGVHVYVSKIAVVCEGEVIGHLINEDPEWLYRSCEAFDV